MNMVHTSQPVMGQASSATAAAASLVDTPLAQVDSVPSGERIGVFGGAFDPPHQAHLALAQAAIVQLELNTLHIIPTGIAWHKARALTSPEHRLAMTRLAFDGMPNVVVDDREIQRGGPTFTIDTLLALRAEHPHAQLFLIMGADQWAAFEQWHRWQEILTLAIICIAGRAHSATASALFDDETKQKYGIIEIKLPLMSVSATQIRQLVASRSTADTALQSLVPEPVARYISQHQLYDSR